MFYLNSEDRPNPDEYLESLTPWPQKNKQNCFCMDPSLFPHRIVGQRIKPLCTRRLGIIAPSTLAESLVSITADRVGTHFRRILACTAFGVLEKLRWGWRIRAWSRD